MLSLDVTWLAQPSAMTNMAKHESIESSVGAPVLNDCEILLIWLCESVGYQKLTFCWNESRMEATSSCVT